jgi:hypothetical protein
MRSTLDLPDELYRRLKAEAALRGTTVKEIVRNAVEREIGLAGATGEKKRRVRFPVLNSSAPGSLRITNREIDDLLA